MAVAVSVAVCLQVTEAVAHPLSTTASERRRRGVVAGTVVVTSEGQLPPWALRLAGCELHPLETQGRPDVIGGMEGVVVLLRPKSRALQATFRAIQMVSEEEDEVSFDDRDDVAVLAPGRPFVVLNSTPRETRLTLFRERDPIKVIDLGPGRVDDSHSRHSTVPSESTVPGLEEGIYSLREAGGTSTHWLYVTPFPATVSGGNCRFEFDDLRAGKYELIAWRPEGILAQREVEPCTRRRCTWLLFSMSRRQGK